MSYWTELDPPMSFIPEGWTYQQKRDFRYRVIPYLEDQLFEHDDYEDKTVLCIGDGSGIDAVEFAIAGAHVGVIDISRKAIDLCNKHAREVGVHRSVLACVGDARDIKLVVEDAPVSPQPWFDVTGHYDIVYSFGVIHHIVEVDKAVSEIARVLKPGGTFMGMVYNRDSLLYAYSILKRGIEEKLSPEEAMLQWSERNPGCPHSVAYTVEELEKLLQRNGFPMVTVDVKYDVIDLPSQRKVPFHMGDGDSGLGWHLFFNARKGDVK